MRLAAVGKPQGWEMPYMPGTMVIFPPGPIRRRVDRLRRKYDRRSADRVSAHVTVTQPFRTEPGKPELDLVNEVLGRFGPFALRFGPLRNFLPYPCIWFEIQPAEQVLAIRNALHTTGLFNTDLEYTEGFVPHMSITDGTPDPVETEQLFNRLKARVRGGEFAVDSLVYARPDWRVRFQPVKTLGLGAPK